MRGLVRAARPRRLATTSRLRARGLGRGDRRRDARRARRQDRSRRRYADRGRPGQRSERNAGPDERRDRILATLTALAIALTRFERAEDLRQFLRVAALAVQLFAVALYVYDPDAISAINGFEATALNTSIALALLLVAIGFDRAAASLRWQLATIGVIVVAPLVALTVHFASAERGNALAAAQDRLAVVARLGAERQDAVIAQTRQMLTLLARSERVKGAGDACNRELVEYAPLYPWVKSLYVVDRDGVVRCGDQASSIGLMVRDRAYVREAFETGEFTISGFVRARVSGQPRIVLAMPSPQGPGVERLVAASVDVEGLAGPLKGLMDDAARGETITLVDSDGVVIARRPRADGQIGANLADATFVTEALANPDRPYVAAELDGRQTVFQARRVLDGRGMLIVGVPKREIVRPVDDRLNNQLLLIASIWPARSRSACSAARRWCCGRSGS